MQKHSTRYFLLFSLVLIGIFLANAWQQDKEDPSLKRQTLQREVAANLNVSSNELPDVVGVSAPTVNTVPKEEHAAEDLINVSTNIFQAKISRQGGDLVYLELKKYPEKYKSPQGFILLDTSSERYLISQSGLLSEVGPDSKALGRAQYQSQASNFVLNQDGSANVDLFYSTATGVAITKRFIFNDDYTISLRYFINNQSNQAYKTNLYGRIKRKPATETSSGFMGSMKTYTGAAVTTASTKYKKISFADMKKAPFKETVLGGWAAMVEHYFTVAWIPEANSSNVYQSEALGDDMFSISYVGELVTVEPGDIKELVSTFYAGPEITAKLQQISPGLELTVDYGLLWVIAHPIFMALKYIYGIVGNWGVAIILVTCAIKLLFYPLSSASYRSMGNMRKLQPKIESLKQQHGDDKQQFGQAVMQLYKKEKVNPLGGCLPIVVQIPVFISLYYVLLESVELRLAPFMLWIHDLSAKDPFYVLPLIMGASMFLQQKMNPAPVDPMQAKVMMFMPIFFTFLFLQFPSGLVLYWVVNNVLSITQQWFITRKIVR